MKKRILSLAMVFLLAMTVTAQAAARWAQNTPVLDISGTKATCSVNYRSAGSNDSVTITLTLKENGVRVAGWSAKGTHTAMISKEYKEVGSDNIYESITARAQAIDGTLTRGVRYTVQSYGRVDFMTKYGPDYEYDTDSVSFTFNLGNTRAVDRTGISDMQLLYQNERADYIIQKFGLNAGQYIYTWDVDVMQYVTPKTYTYMRETMDINPGDTSPSFFVDEESNTIYGVYQDTNAVNHLFKFCKSEDGEWYTNDTKTTQDLASYTNTIGTFSEFEKSLNVNK